MTTYSLAGFEIPRIGLGTNRLTTDHVAFDRHIDTAHLYTSGESERAIGEALHGVSGEPQITPHRRDRPLLPAPGRPEREHDDVIDYCEREGIAFVPYFPLRGERPGVTDNAATLAWLLERSPVVLPIPGTLSIAHLRENLAADN